MAGGWLVLHFMVFSLSRGIIHTYYLVMLTPAIAAPVVMQPKPPNGSASATQ